MKRVAPAIVMHIEARKCQSIGTNGASGSSMSAVGRGCAVMTGRRWWLAKRKLRRTARVLEMMYLCGVDHAVPQRAGPAFGTVVICKTIPRMLRRAVQAMNVR